MKNFGCEKHLMEVHVVNWDSWDCKHFIQRFRVSPILISFIECRVKYLKYTSCTVTGKAWNSSKISILRRHN